MTGQMTEHLAAQIAGDADKGETRDPACNSPQKVIGGDQCDEENKCQPYACGMTRTCRQAVDEELDAILRAHRTGNCAHYGSKDDEVRDPALLARRKKLVHRSLEEGGRSVIESRGIRQVDDDAGARHGRLQPPAGDDVHAGGQRVRYGLVARPVQVRLRPHRKLEAVRGRRG